VVDPSRIWEKVGRRFRGAGDGWRSEPKRFNLRWSNQIQGFWPKRTQGSYLTRSLSVTAEIGPFFSKFNCEPSPPIKDSVLRILSMLPPIPITELAKVARESVNLT